MIYTVVGSSFWEKWDVVPEEGIAERKLRIHAGRRDSSMLAVTIKSEKDFEDFMLARYEPVKYIKKG